MRGEVTASVPQTRRKRFFLQRLQELQKENARNSEELSISL